MVAQAARSAAGITDVRLDYIEMNDPAAFGVLADEMARPMWEAVRPGAAARRPVILSGAMWVGKTRLIDNIVLGARDTLGISD